MSRRIINLSSGSDKNAFIVGPYFRRFSFTMSRRFGGEIRSGIVSVVRCRCRIRRFGCGREGGLSARYSGRRLCVSRSVSGRIAAGCCTDGSTVKRSRSGHLFTRLIASFIIADILCVKREPDHELVFVIKTHVNP